MTTIQTSFAWPESTAKLSGLRPAQFCELRLNWFRYERIPQLEIALTNGITTAEHLASAIAENSARVAQYESELARAEAWELSRYGNCSTDELKARAAA